MPDYNIWPSVPHTVEKLPDGSSDIVIPKLVPRKEITISYLYFPPETVVDINAGIESDEGFAQEIPVLLQRIYPQWFNLLALFLFVTGAITVIYLADPLVLGLFSKS